MDKILLLNCLKIPFNNNLGVTKYLLNLVSALKDSWQILFMVDDVSEIDKSPHKQTILDLAKDILNANEVSNSKYLQKSSVIELLPHHFQKSYLNNTSVIICHDLHIFDIPWKYSDIKERTLIFNNNMKSSNAVVTHFPRTYYMLEHMVNTRIKNLFLTESPLMLDTSFSTVPKLNDKSLNNITENTITKFLYPAQLQLHKNHEAIIRAVSKLSISPSDLNIMFPGSEFNKDITSYLKNLCKELSVENIVQFPGMVSDNELLTMYRSCDAVIVPSLAEGGAYVPMEAIASGKPVAVNEIDSAKLHLKSSNADVYWFNSNDQESTINAIKIFNGR